MKIAYKRPFSKSQSELRRCSKKEKTVITLKNKNNATTGTIVILNLRTPIFVSHAIENQFRGRKVNHLERCAHSISIASHRIAQRDYPRCVWPFDVLTCFQTHVRTTRRFLLCDTKGGGDDGWRHALFVYSVCYCCYHSLYHLKKQKKTRNVNALFAKF